MEDTLDDALERVRCGDLHGRSLLVLSDRVLGVTDHFIDSPRRDYMGSRFAHVELLMTGILFGGLVGVIN